MLYPGHLFLWLGEEVYPYAEDIVYYKSHWQGKEELESEKKATKILC